MTTMRVLLTRAMRRTRARSLVDTPTENEMDAALEDAQAFFMGLTARTLTDVLTAVNYTAGEDERVFNTSGSPITVTLPETVTIWGVERPPRAGALVEVAASATRSIYIADQGAWNAVTGLTLATEQPFGLPMDDALADMLAVRMCDAIFQREPSAMLVALASQARSAFDARFSKPLNVVVDPGIRARPYPYVEVSL